MFKKYVDSSNFLDPNLSILEWMMRGNTPFMLRLIDNVGNILNILNLGLDQDNWKSIINNIIKGQTLMNPLFNLDNVEWVEIYIKSNFTPAKTGEIFNGVLEIDGLVDTKSGTRGEYSHDPDLTPEEAEYLKGQLQYAKMAPLTPVKEYKVYGITSWPEILTVDGLNFRIGGHKFSAFHIGNTIYIPHKNIIMDKIQLDNERLRKAPERRRNIILHHEVHEIKTGDHKYATLTEFEDNIDGLNYADIVTILLSTLINNRINKIDYNFHNLFIKKLLIEGMPISFDTYTKILVETLNTSISLEDYDKIVQDCTRLVSTFLGDRLIHTEGIEVDIDKERMKNEPGYNEFEGAVQTQPGNTLIDLSRFFVKNDTLSNAVTIDTEYFKKFIYFAKRLNPNITLVGITSESKGDPIIKQLISLIREHLSNFEIYDNIDFKNYQDAIQNLGLDIQHTVSILSEESVRKIGAAGDLKIIAPIGSGYNRVVTVWQEFRIAIEGIDKTKQEFLSLIIQIADNLLEDLVAKKQITTGAKQDLLREIQTKGIGFIPVYFDPIQYYRSIEQMKSLLIAA